MSIEDESFPDVEFFDDLDNTHKTTSRYQFPNRRRRQQKSNNTSASSTDQNLSEESTNGRSSSSGMSEQTATSDPTGLADKEAMKKGGFSGSPPGPNKTMSCQNFHTEYTKRRFKHVESKVGKYIATIKAEEKRRNSDKFQRSQSKPETKSAGAFPAEDSGSDAEEANAATYIDKHAYGQLMDEHERIQSYNEHLQAKLYEKDKENIRLKQNVEYMRIELNTCQDQLKKQINLVNSNLFSRHFNLYSMDAANLTKGTQTEVILPTPGSPKVHVQDIYITPTTPDANNNHMYESTGPGPCPCPVNGVKSGKNVATIQPLSLNFSNIAEQDSEENNTNRTRSNDNNVLRQRTNSNPSAKASLAPPSQRNNVSKNPSSSDSAIDIEATDASPKQNMRRLFTAAGQKRVHSQRREEFVYYDQRSGRYACLETLDASNTSNERSRHDTGTPATSVGGEERRGRRKRRRWLRLFGRCTRCQDENQTLDASAAQTSQTQIPLLEKSFEEMCRSLR